MQIKNPDKKHIAALVDLWKSAFGDSEEFINCFLNTAFSPERCLIATDGDCLTAALYWIDCSFLGKKIAYIYAVATKEEYRGRGICKALMNEVHHCLHSLGYYAAILVPAKESLYSFYGKIGYKPFGGISEFSAERSTEKLDLTEISKEEFEHLRRGMLPRGAIIQEGESLAYLASQATFYKADSLLMVSSVSNSRLFVYELLGDKRKAGAILNSLDCDFGIFRCPGLDKRFAMIFPLSDAFYDVPEYFAFAFD